MNSVPNADVALKDTHRRGRAKERLYAVCQICGWGSLLAIQLVLWFVFGRYDNPRQEILMGVVVQAVVMVIGLLLSHYARRYMRPQGWTQLGWRMLVPRVLGAAFVLSVLWCGLGYAVAYGVMRQPLPAEKYSPVVLFALSCLQGTIIYTAWLGLYFFYHLFDRFNRSEIERLRLSTHVKEAELRALKSQVNPHFIFNSLNSLRALIEEDPRRAREAVTQLANLLRYSLQSGQLETVPFADELKIANDYLALEQVRHEERLRVKIDVTPDTLQLPIPPLLLQTLVENAVKYGIASRAEGGEIVIIARRDQDALRLQVTNPGQLATAQTRSAASSTGVGLQNAAERLRLLFGEGASLQLRTDRPNLVVAEAVVPLALVRV